jgi:DNA-binding MarR family transcriptional regulator
MTAEDRKTYESLAAFRFALRKFLAFSEAATQAAGVTAQQYQVLLVVRAEPSGAIMMRDLAEQMLLQPNGAVQMVNRLVNLNLVQRHKSPVDGRSVLVSLTAIGSELVDRLASQHVTELQEQEPLLVEALNHLLQIGRMRRGLLSI